MQHPQSTLGHADSTNISSEPFFLTERWARVIESHAVGPALWKLATMKQHLELIAFLEGDLVAVWCELCKSGSPLVAQSDRGKATLNVTSTIDILFHGSQEYGAAISWSSSTIFVGSNSSTCHGQVQHLPMHKCDQFRKTSNTKKEWNEGCRTHAPGDIPPARAG